MSLPGFSGQSASVLQFSNFSATQGSTIDFNWIASFEQFSEGYAFVLLDGQRTVLQHQFNLSALTSGGALSVLALNSTHLTIGVDGAHKLSFGIVEGCSSCLLFNANLLDPSATFRDITLTNATATPEPATSVYSLSNRLAVQVLHQTFRIVRDDGVHMGVNQPLPLFRFIRCPWHHL